MEQTLIFLAPRYTSKLVAYLCAAVIVFHPNIARLGQAALLAAQGPAPSGSPTDEAYLAAIAGAPCCLVLALSVCLLYARTASDLSWC